jgi:hypothetical protein
MSPSLSHPPSPTFFDILRHAPTNPTCPAMFQSRHVPTCSDPCSCRVPAPGPAAWAGSGARGPRSPPRASPTPHRSFARAQRGGPAAPTPKLGVPAPRRCSAPSCTRGCAPPVPCVKAPGPPPQGAGPTGRPRWAPSRRLEPPRRAKCPQGASCPAHLPLFRHPSHYPPPVPTCPVQAGLAPSICRAKGLAMRALGPLKRDGWPTDVCGPSSSRLRAACAGPGIKRPPRPELQQPTNQPPTTQNRLTTPPLELSPTHHKPGGN